MKTLYILIITINGTTYTPYPPEPIEKCMGHWQFERQDLLNPKLKKMNVRMRCEETK